ncbi:Methionine aminopeptidase [Serinicoccus hydrothermalis]|uniref:Methionine aminopeptidase n=1 Tax=Serinicoccus hydrothermalis TaxID=1758689 RepID=A0A1B1NG36_9MICO|nr:M24 family metallopeptidase [Serinicoccus hydrothermalis]ANS80363.1 Methionine aminopeptidase [Serinicoccus hydrothermalis]
MIEILTPAQTDQARRTGRLVGEILRTVKARTDVGTNLLDIDRWAREMILGAGAESCYVDYAPSFGKGPFGHWICTSVNDAVLHGLPHDDRLADGDLLSLDLAVSLHGVAADAAISFVVGRPRSPDDQRMIDTTQRALAAGIAAARPGARVGDLSHAIGTVLSGAGCVHLAVTADPLDPRRVNNSEVWRDRAALEAWRPQAHAPEQPAFESVEMGFYEARAVDPL